MAEEAQKLTVGQTLWWVSSHGGDARPVKIEKIGRKWVLLSNRHRIDRTTLRADAGRCYVHLEEFECERKTNAAWLALRRVVGLTYRPPAGVNHEAIKQAAGLLGLELQTRS